MQRITNGSAIVVASLLFLVPAVSCESGTDSGSRLADMIEGLEIMAWESDYRDGAWEPDWDDAAFYGPAYYAHKGWEEGREDYKQRAGEAVARNLDLAREALDGHRDSFLRNMTELLYGTLGIMDYMAASGDDSGMETVDETLDVANDMARILADDYLEGFSNYSMDTYGPTVVTAMLAVVNLQYAVLLDTPRRPDRIEKARSILERIEEKAWNGTFYQFDPDRTDELFLYPNIIMIIALVRMAQVTDEEEFLVRAEETAEAIEPLRYADRPGFHSPYSAEVMGAQTDDYSTLSSTSYTIFAFALLNQITGDERYRDEFVSLLEFITEYLYVPADGKAYHHWMDGRLAVPDDPEYFCIGCNLQILYVVWWIRSNLGWNIK